MNAMNSNTITCKYKKIAYKTSYFPSTIYFLIKIIIIYQVITLPLTIMKYVQKNYFV